MSPQDLFGVCLRVIGVWSIWQGFQYFVGVIDSLGNWTNSITEHTFPTGYMLYTVSYVGFGIILLAFPNTITRATYPAQQIEDEEEAQPLKSE